MEPVQTTKGMNSDVDPNFQPEGTYRVAVNMILESEDGNIGTIVSERGTSLAATINLPIIGFCDIDEQTTIIFSADDTDSEIGIFNPKTNLYTVIVNSVSLNFRRSHPIECVYRVINGCDRVLYFTDNLNPHRSLNIDRLDLYGSPFDALKTNTTRDATFPLISPTVLNSGGSLSVGAKQFAIRYLDAFRVPTRWSPITNHLNIYYPSVSTAYESIYGSFASNDVLTDTVVPKSSKAIQLFFFGLDTNFPFYQVAILESSSGTGVVSHIYQMPEVPVPGSTDTYILSDTSIGTQISLDDIIIDNFPVEKVLTQTQTENKLYIANTTNEEYNWGAFQQAANSITVTWVKNQIAVFDQNKLGDALSPYTPFSTRTFKGDEVYSIGIRYLIKGKYFSPAMHIPGRVSIASDLVNITAGLETNHLPGAGPFPTWLVQNTATEGTPNTMAYYEATQNYPDTTTCDNTRVYPTGKIRHHKMPDRKLVPIYEVVGGDVVLNVLGLTFSNITYPHSDVVGHQFVITPHTEATKSVLDTGIMTDIAGVPTVLPWVFGGDSGNGMELEPVIDTQNAYLLWTPKSLAKQNMTGNHIKFLKLLNESFGERQDRVNAEFTDGTNFETRIAVREYANNPSAVSISNRYYDSSLYVDPQTFQSPTGVFTDGIQNNSFFNSIFITHYTDTFTLPEGDGFYLIANKKYVRPFESLGSLFYIPMHSYALTLADLQTVYGGDAFLTHFHIYDLHNEDTVGDNRLFYGSCFQKIWVESELNYSLRVEGSEDRSIYHPVLDPGTDSFSIPNYAVLRLGAKTDTNNVFERRETPFRESYIYNPDFHKLNIESPSFPLKYSSDFCNECGSKLPYRVWISNEGTQEEKQDSYRVFKALSYTEVPATHGEITKLFADKDIVYIRTKEGLFQIPANPQTIEASSNNIYLTNTNVNPKLLTPLNVRFGGSSDRWDLVQTPYGTFYTDSESGKVFHLSDGLKEITNGKRNYLRQNLPLNLKHQFTNYNLDNAPTHPYGTGIIAVYDPRYRRYIFHKKDYRAIAPSLIYYDSATEQFKEVDGDSVIFLHTTGYFENRSFTMSYSIPHQSWVSFHTYKPNYFWNTHNEYFGHYYGYQDENFDDTKLWRHGNGLYNFYYNEGYKSTLDLVFKTSPLQTEVFKSLKLNFVIEEKFGSTDSFYELAETTLESIWAFNDRQSTGTMPVINKVTAFDESIPGTCLIEKIDNYWQVADLRDYLIDYQSPFIDKNWAILPAFDFVPYEPDPSVHSVSKSLFDIQRLKGTWLGVRLVFNPDQENYRLKYTLSHPMTSISFR